ncbi:MAG: hypothetical protein NC293_07450 [Roseburia sp.]|nr:hypothetical protein [Roseburia sp.]
MTGITGTGSATMAQGVSAASYQPKKTVAANDDKIQVNASETILDEYRENGVDLELSDAWEKYTDEELDKMREEDEKKSLREMYQEQAEAAKEAAEATGERFEDMARALEIARRMMNGDRVPGSDEKFLMDFDKDMYLGAKSMQGLAQKKDPKDYDSLLEEEEQEEDSVQENGGEIVVDASGLNLCQTPQKNSLE